MQRVSTSFSTAIQFSFSASSSAEVLNRDFEVPTMWRVSRSRKKETFHSLNFTSEATTLPPNEAFRPKVFIFRPKW